MHRRSSPSHRSSGNSRRRSPSPRRRSPPRDRDRYSSRPRDRSHEREKQRPESELPTEFCRDRDEDGKRGAEDNKNVLEKMEKAYCGGPLNLLYQAAKGKWKLKIWTRNFKEVRGICTGYVKAFDKHWNLAMTDVDEICLKPKKGKTPFLLDVNPEDIERLPEAKPKEYKKKEKKADVVTVATEIETMKVQSSADETATDAEGEPKAADKPKKRSRKKKKNKIDKRHVNKLFIRGDNIVMLCVIDHGPSSAKPAEEQGSES